MPSITVHIADAGNALSNGGSSDVGHMWFTLTDALGNKYSYGFSPRDPGDPWGVGEIHTDDDMNYIDPSKNITVEISEQQFADIEGFAENAKRDSDAGIGRWEEYNGLTNSCVDFLWQALNSGHLTDTPESGWQGAIWPTWNKFALEQMLLKQSIQSHSDLLDGIKRLFHQAEITRSPLVLDLNGDGVSTIAMTAGVHFDQNNNRFAELSGWVNKNDGLLVRDLNGNGRVAAQQRGTHRPTPSFRSRRFSASCSEGRPLRSCGCNLAVDTFHRSFIDVIPTTPQTVALPDMQGNGVVNDVYIFEYAANEAVFEMRRMG